MNIQDFLVGQNSKATLEAYKTDLKQFELMAGGELTRGGVILFRDTLLKEGLSTSTVARKMSSVRSYCQFLRGQGLLSKDPFAGVKAPKVSVAEPTEAFTDDEVKKIFKVCKDRKDSFIRNRDLIVLSLLFYAGLRRNEIITLRFCDVLNIEGQLILKILGKGSKYRMIPAHPTLAEVLLPVVTAPPLIPEPSKSTAYLLGIGRGTIYKIVKRYAKMIGITRNVSPHSCRATAISQLLENGESPRNVADFAGHSSVNTTIGSYDKKRDGIKNSSAMKLKF